MIVGEVPCVGERDGSGVSEGEIVGCWVEGLHAEMKAANKRDRATQYANCFACIFKSLIAVLFTSI